MKRLIYLIMLFEITLLNTSCQDDSWKSEIELLKKELALQKELIMILEKKLTIDQIEYTKDGFQIKFSDGTYVNIENGTIPLIAIGENGNWFIDGVDTGKTSIGPSGDTPSIVIGINGNWYINNEDSGISATGKDGFDAPHITNIINYSDKLVFVFSDNTSIEVPLNIENNKHNKEYIILSKNSNLNTLNPSYPFWPKSNKDIGFRWIRANFNTLRAITINEVKVKGAYITDDLELGKGYINVRIYKGVTGDIDANFDNAVLLGKARCSVEDFFNKSCKGQNYSELKANLENSDNDGYVFKLNDIKIEANSEFQILIGIDDDLFYQTNRTDKKPECRFSFATGNNISNSYIKNTYKTIADLETGVVTMNTSAPLPAIAVPCVKQKMFINQGYIKISSRDKYTYVGAQNFIIDQLIQVKPNAKIALISHHTEDGRNGDQSLRPLVDVQQKLSEYWGFHYLPLWKHLGWIKKTRPDNSIINTYITNVPDEIHPYSNPEKVHTEIGIQSVADVQIARLVENWLFPIFGEDWKDKKVVCYGTSIPYGGKYIDLAVKRLGGVCSNRCESGSVIRAGKTDETPHQYGMFSVIGSDKSRNYKKDMIDLIGTADEPDLFIFDFGINDFGLDEVDFDISDQN